MYFFPTGIWIQDFLRAKQALYYWAVALVYFNFWDKVSLWHSRP